MAWRSRSGNGSEGGDGQRRRSVGSRSVSPRAVAAADRPAALRRRRQLRGHRRVLPLPARSAGRLAIGVGDHGHRARPARRMAGGRRARPVRRLCGVLRCRPCCCSRSRWAPAPSPSATAPPAPAGWRCSSSPFARSGSSPHRASRGSSARISSAGGGCSPRPSGCRSAGRWRARCGIAGRGTAFSGLPRLPPSRCPSSPPARRAGRPSRCRPVSDGGGAGRRAGHPAGSRPHLRRRLDRRRVLGRGGCRRLRRARAPRLRRFRRAAAGTDVR